MHDMPQLLPGPFTTDRPSEHPREWRLAIADPYIRQHDWWVANIDIPAPANLTDPAGNMWPHGWSRWHEAEEGRLTIVLKTMPAEPAVLYPDESLSPLHASDPDIYTLDIAPTPRLFFPTSTWGTGSRRLQVACQDEHATWRLILHYVEPGPLYNRAAIHPRLRRALTLNWTEAARG